MEGFLIKTRGKFYSCARVIDYADTVTIESSKNRLLRPWSSTIHDLSSLVLINRVISHSSPWYKLSNSI